MKSSIKEDLKQRAFVHLDANLAVEIKKSISPAVLMQILDCLSEWIYDERANVMAEFSRQVANRVQTQTPEKVQVEDPDFMKALQKT